MHLIKKNVERLIYNIIISPSTNSGFCKDTTQPIPSIQYAVSSGLPLCIQPLPHSVKAIFISFHISNAQKCLFSISYSR